jgi:LPXTG-motif cell wall-anchored protein
METRMVVNTFAERARGQHYALIIGIVGICAGAACVVTGHDTAGAVIGGTALVGLVSAFIYGRRKESAGDEE